MNDVSNHGQDYHCIHNILVLYQMPCYFRSAIVVIAGPQTWLLHLNKHCAARGAIPPSQYWPVTSTFHSHLKQKMSELQTVFHCVGLIRTVYWWTCVGTIAAYVSITSANTCGFNKADRETTLCRLMLSWMEDRTSCITWCGDVYLSG